MIRIGIVGVGFMGMIHYLAARKLKGARVTAICSRDARKRAGDWRGIRGNFGPPGTQMDLSRVKAYAHLDELLDDPDIDMVDICNPTEQHGPTAIKALKSAISISPANRAQARSDSDFDSIRDEADFVSLVYSQAS